MNAQDLARWTRFAAKGGIGRCTAIVDCVAVEMGEDLMFLKDDEITVLMQLPEEGFFLGHCEGVVGRFSGKDVRFHGKLKKPVITKRASVASGAERISIAVMERSVRADTKEKEGGEWQATEGYTSTGRRSPSPTHSEKSLARSFASMRASISSKEKEDREWSTGKDGKHRKSPAMASSVSGSSVYSVRSTRSVSTATSVSAYSTASSASGSVASDATETEYAGITTSPSSPSLPSARSDGLTSSSSGTSFTSFATHGSSGTDSTSAGSSVDIKFHADDKDPVSPRRVPSSASTSISASNLPPIAPLRLSKSPRHIPSNLPSGSSPIMSSPSTDPSSKAHNSLSPGLSASLSPLPGSLSPGPGRSLSPGSPAPSPGLSVSFSPVLPGSHSPSPRSPMFPSRSPVHISSGASTSSLPLPNPYGPNLSGSYVSLSGGYMSMSPPPSAPPTGPLPPAPKPSEKQAIKQTLELEDGEDELGEGNSTLLSTLDAFRRRLREEDEGESVESQSEEEGIRTSSGGWLGRLSSGDFNEAVVIKPEEGAKEVMCSAGERRPSDAGVGGEDGHSDGEVGIGLSLMSALDGDGDDDDDEAVPSASAHVASTSATIDGSNCASAPLTQYAPEAPSEPCSVKDQSENGQVQSSTSAQDKVDTEGIDGSHPEPEDEEDECEMAEDDEGGYWDDIYDDYRYSRYSLASKRFSVASRRMSVVSKGSAGSKTSGTSKSSRAPPMPVPPFSPDHPGFSAERPRASADRRSFERPSFGSDRPSQASERDGRPSLYSRPSFESASTTASAESSVLQSPSHPFTQSFDLSLSDDARSSSYSTQTLDRLSSQFPAVPTGVPVRVESRLRIVNDGHVELEEDMHREKEMEVAHESTGDETSPAMKEESEVKKSLVADDKNRYQVDKPTANSMVSPLLHTTFGSPHSSRVYTDTEGSEHGHRSWSLYRSKSPRSSRHDEDNDLPAGALKSPFESQGAPVEDGGLGSVLNKAGGEGSCALPSATLSENVSGAEIGMKVNVVNDNDADLASTGGDDSFVTSSADTSQTATAPPSTSSTPKPDEQQSSHHLRPPNRVHPFSRTSIFLPHPNAPKSAGHQGLGPMYARPIQAQHYSATPGGPGSVLSPSLPPNSSAFAAPVLHHLRSAFLVHSPGSGMPARRPPMTIFARCQPELSESIGPVPIVFSLEPLPPLTPSPTGPPRYGQNSASPLSPTRSATLPPPAPKSPIAANVSEPSGAGVSIGNAGETSANVSSPTEMQLRLPKRSATTSVFPSEPARDTIRPAVMTAAAVTAPTLPIPRAGFVPQVGGDVRPRSRSFSEFGAKVTEPVLPEKSREEPGPGPRLRQYSALPRSFTSRPIPPPLNLPSNTVNQDVLALSSSNATHSPHSASFKPIASPISPSPTAPARQAIPHPLASSGSVPVSTASTSPAFVPSPTQEKDSQAPTGRTSALSSYPRNVTSPRSWIQTHGGSLDVPQQDSVDSCPPCQSSDSDDPAPVVQSLPIPDNIRGTQQSPIAHEIPLRNKLSLPVLRGKTTTRQRLDDAISITSSHGGLGGSTENETVQVQDMDFELVKPSIPHITGRTSQDSTLASHDPHIDPVSPSPLGDTASIHSSAPRSPLVVNEQTSDNALDAQAAADAHRQREVRWMALLPTVPPSQARKNKKVRRLLQDGVPSSLRYLIWCHLTDSKARAIPGVYAKLSKRPRVPAFAEIERDTTKCFPDQPQLHSAQGPVVSVLQAYLSMVPDIQYSSALTSIAGHLLQLAPEEDAFWIFASMMDAHLRPYFSSSTIQMEVDAALFSKAIETNDSVLSKKLYVTLQIGPVDVIRPWFSNLFVGTLPIDHLHRIWDMFLYEGVTLLFRIGLAIVHCVRHLLLQATSEEIALAHLIHPPVACLPSSPEDLLTLSFNMKLKDDVRKQRVKMEAQVKRQTQARALPANGISSRQTTSISLPRP